MLELIDSIKLEDTKPVYSSLLHFCTLELPEREIKTFPLAVASERTK